MAKISYREAGVDIQAGAQIVDAIQASAQSTYTPQVVSGVGGFGALYDASALSQMQQPLLVSGSDGVGTKLELAARLGRLDSVGIDLVAMCANDVLTTGAAPLFFLDYIAAERLEPAMVQTVVEGIAQGCKLAGCALVGGESAEHPGVLPAGSFDLSGFCVGAVDRPALLGADKVQEGDVILGLASSGIHSNGYSLVRKALTDGKSDEELNTTMIPGGHLLADALLMPTAIYVKPVLEALAQGIEIHAAAHITGGGITHNLDRVLPQGLDAEVRLGSWTVPEVIQMMAEATGLNVLEMLETFNMGIGMALVVPQESVLPLTKLLLQYDFLAWRDGYRKAEPDKHLEPLEDKSPSSSDPENNLGPEAGCGIGRGQHVTKLVEASIFRIGKIVVGQGQVTYADKYGKPFVLEEQDA
jgi:phosphoribosylformylglycinamidine cyclo-ligase